METWLVVLYFVLIPGSCQWQHFSFWPGEGDNVPRLIQSTKRPTIKSRTRLAAIWLAVVWGSNWKNWSHSCWSGQSNSLPGHSRYFALLTDWTCDKFVWWLLVQTWGLHNTLNISDLRTEVFQAEHTNKATFSVHDYYSIFASQWLACIVKRGLKWSNDDRRTLHWTAIIKLKYIKGVECKRKKNKK